MMVERHNHIFKSIHIHNFHVKLEVHVSHWFLCSFGDKEKWEKVRLPLGHTLYNTLKNKQTRMEIFT